MGCGALKQGSDSKHSNHMATEAAAAVVVVRVIGRSGFAAGALRVCLCPSCNHIATRPAVAVGALLEGNCHLDWAPRHLDFKSCFFLNHQRQSGATESIGGSPILSAHLPHLPVD